MRPSVQSMLFAFGVVFAGVAYDFQNWQDLYRFCTADPANWHFGTCHL